MLEDQSVTTASISLAVGVFSISVALLLWLRFERANRDEDLSDADTLYYARQDRRRNAGLAILLVLAQGIAISPQIERRVAGRPSVLFLAMWLFLFLLILVLLGIAFLDMIAARAYARRHRDEIMRARNELFNQIERLARRDRIKDDTSNPDPDSAKN